MTENPRRMPAGVPAGGQFAISRRREASNVLVMPLALDTIVPPDTALTYNPAESGSEVFEQVTIQRVAHNDAFRVTGARPIDLHTAVSDYLGDTDEATSAWLAEHEDVIAEHLDDRYDARLDPDATDARTQRILTHADVACDTRLDSAFEALDRTHGAQRLHGSDDETIAHGMVQAVNAWTNRLHDHDMGAHEEWGHAGDPACPECQSAESRLQDMADELRKGESA